MHKNFKPIITACIFSTAVTITLPACANEPVTSTKINKMQRDDLGVYAAAFFDQYAPRNALEMVQKLPGFSFEAGESERGFGANAGNVLIDGVRPTTKSGGLAAALTRIPASQVEQIKIIRGNTTEAEGHAIVANIVSIKSQTHGSWAMRFRQTEGTDIEPNIEAVIRLPIGQWETAFDLDIGMQPYKRTAVVERRDANNILISGASETLPYNDNIGYFNGEGSRTLAGGTLTLNGRFAADQDKGDLNQKVYDNRLPDNSAADSSWQYKYKDNGRLGEFGIDWIKTQHDWKLRLLSLAVVNDSHDRYDYRQHNASGTWFDSTYAQDRLKTEYVARATYGQVANTQFKPEFGFEVANNRLDTNAVIKNNNELTPTFETVFGSDVVVEELRSEAFANFVYQPQHNLTVEGGLTVEVSQIKVSGDANRKQTFEFIKPRFAASYQVDEKMRLTLEAQRRVGQLSFNEFASNSFADENRTTTGNPALAPNQTNEVATTFDWRFSERGSLKVKADYQWRKDILEQIVISTDQQGNINQGLGNAGDATLWGVTTDLRLPLNSIIHNGLIDIHYRWRRSDFDDPIIGKERTMSEMTPEWLSFDFRQDLTEYQLAWGLNYNGSFNYDYYLVNEIQTNSANKRLLFFIETTRFFGVKIQLEVAKVNHEHFNRTRHFYQDTRAGEYLGSEVAKREEKPYFALSTFGTF